MNKLFYGDNLDILRRFIRDETIDLCYIDPPFNSKRNYNQIYNNIGQEDRAQAQAFMDTWTWDDHANHCFEDILTNKNGVQTQQSIALMTGLEKVLGKGSLFAYLVSMTVRVAEIHRVLKDTGSFYFHCDTVADSYLRLIIDSIFVPKGGEFRNEISWKRADAHSDAKKQFGMISDRILFYTKGKNYVFHPQYGDYNEKTLRDWYLWLELPNGTTRRMTKQERETQIIPEGARRFNTGDMSAPVGGGMAAINKTTGKPNGWHIYKGYNPPLNGWRYSPETMVKLDAEGKLLFPENPDGRIMLKRYLDEQKGSILGDIWTDISQLRSATAEMLGYPTQKPEALLERIINASSNEGDVVLDTFCGCGTTVAVANRLKRKWIGMDITYQSVALILKRLKDSEGQEAIDKVELHGVPKDMESVDALIHKKDDRVRKEFEKWAILTYSDNRAVINEKKGADKGIDGVAYTRKSREEILPVMISVRSGNVNASVIRDLRGVVERENAACGILITRQEPTAPMRQEAKSAGQFKPENFSAFDKLQIVTVQEILDGARMNLPLMEEVTKKAQKAKVDNQASLFLD